MKRTGSNPLIVVCLLALVLLPVCACTYQGDEFTFSAPLDFKTRY